MSLVQKGPKCHGVLICFPTSSEVCLAAGIFHTWYGIAALVQKSMPGTWEEGNTP